MFDELLAQVFDLRQLRQAIKARLPLAIHTSHLDPHSGSLIPIQIRDIAIEVKKKPQYTTPQLSKDGGKWGPEVLTQIEI